MLSDVTAKHVCALRKLKVAQPWDIKIDPSLNALDNSNKLTSEVLDCEFTHWAPNCATFTRAREKPISYNKHGPPPLRSDQHPAGLPCIIHGPDCMNKERVIKDTAMANLAAQTALRCHQAGLGFSIEHPGRSIALHLPSWIELLAQPGVLSIHHHHCMFAGCTHRKFQVLITNVPELKDCIGLICDNSGTCNRTGPPHPSWKHSIDPASGRINEFATGKLSEYPSGFCASFAQGLTKWLHGRPCNRSCAFMEVFSGPNAPLSKAVESSLVTLTQQSAPTNWTQLRQDESKRVSDYIASTRTPAAMPNNKTGLTLSDYQKRDLESGRQPKWSSKHQLIADGLSCPNEHIRLARMLQHPGAQLASVSEEQMSCVRAVVHSPQKTVYDRMQTVLEIERLASELSAENDALVHSHAGCTFKCALRHR